MYAQGLGNQGTPIEGDTVLTAFYPPVVGPADIAKRGEVVLTVAFAFSNFS